MRETEHHIKIFDVGTRSRELWSDVCTFSVIICVFGVGWIVDSDAMQWFGFVSILLALVGRATMIVKKFDPQGAADWLYEEYGVTASEKRK